MRIPYGKLAILLVLTLATGGCMSFPGPNNSIGTLRVTGGYIWLNNVAAHDDMTVHVGDTLTTGPGSSAILDFRDGGILQLDENTDPLFSWIEQTKCILIRIVRGQTYIRRGKACVESPNISLVLNSAANIQVEKDLSTVTVLEGHGTLEKPGPVQIATSQQATVAGKKVRGSVRTLSSAELATIVSWRQKYHFKEIESGPTFDFQAPILIRPGFDHRRQPTSPPPKPPPTTYTPG